MPRLDPAVLILLCVAVVARAAVLPFLPALSYAALPIENVWYYQALDEHLYEYVAFTTYRPPVTYLLHAAIIELAGPATAYEQRLFLIATFMLDVAGALLLYGAARRLGVGRAAASAMIGIFAVALVPWEIWRDGSHYDHLTIFLASAFAAALTRFAADASARSAALLALCGGVYVAQSPAALYAVPLTAGIAVFLGTRRAWRSRLSALIVVVLVPLLVAAPIVARNYAEARTLATGNQAGSSLIIFVHEATGPVSDPAAALFEDGAVPPWYRWCFDNARPFPGYEEDPAWKVLMRAYGVCFPWTSPHDATWPFDFANLHAELERQGETAAAELVLRDIEDMRDRRYLFAGFSPEQSARWVGVYGSVSQRLALGLMVRHPDWTARTILLTLARYVRHGAFLPLRVTVPPAENGMRTLSGPVPFEAPLRLAAFLFAAVALMGLLAAAAHAVSGAARVARRSARVVDRNALLLSLPIAFVSAIVLLGAWDVDRYFMQVSPYVVLSAAITFVPESPLREWMRSILHRIPMDLRQRGVSRAVR